MQARLGAAEMQLAELKTTAAGAHIEARGARQELTAERRRSEGELERLRDQLAQARWQRCRLRHSGCRKAVATVIGWVTIGSRSRWLRQLTIVFDTSLTAQEQTRMIGEVNGPVEFTVQLPSYPWPWQRAVARQVMDATGEAGMAALNEHLNPAMETTRYLLERPSEATGRPREDLMQEMAIVLDAVVAEDPPPPEGPTGGR